MIYYLHWRNCLVTAAYNYFKIVWDCQQILVCCSPNKSTQLLAWSSILKFNIQHTIQYLALYIMFNNTQMSEFFKIIRFKAQLFSQRKKFEVTLIKTLSRC